MQKLHELYVLALSLAALNFLAPPAGAATPAGAKFSVVAAPLHYQPLTDDRYDSATDFHEGLAAVKKDNKWGFVDITGKLVIAPQFNPYQSQFHSYFSEGLVAINLVSAKKNGVDGNDPAGTRWGFADSTGKIVIKPQFEASYYNPPHFSEGLAAISGHFIGTTVKTFGINVKYGYIDKTGKFVVPQIYDEAFDFSEGLAAVKVDKKYGFIDKTGHMIIPPMYDSAGFFRDGVAVVELNKLSYVIDKNNKKVFEKGYMSMSVYAEGLARFEDNLRVGFIDRAGNVKIKPTLDFGSDEAEKRMYFSEGLCPIQVGDIAGTAQQTRITRRYGYINTSGKMVIAPQFEYAGPFKNGIAVVAAGGYYGFINRNGEFLIQPIFANVGYFTDRVARVSGGGKFGDYKYRFIKITP